MTTPSSQSTDQRRSWRPPAEATLRSRLGPYRLCLKIGEGGMASIYLARTGVGEGSHRPLAIKVIHPHLASDRAFIDMFLDEAEIASRIHHVNVCSIVDYAADGDGYYIAMEYVVGESLMALWRKLSRSAPEDRDLFARRIAHVLSGICEGLHAAHELCDADGDPLHVVHRDVSPENVFLTYDGTVKIVDFGVASALHKRHRTRTGMVKGKFAYVAPETLRGAKPDRRIDIWGVGVIAWELLTGRRLFRQETDVDTLHAVTEAEILPPSQVLEGLPPELDAIVLRALRREPSERYATARELGKELAAFAGKSGGVVGAGDLGRWLEEVFPGGRARHQHVIDLAAQLDRDSEGTASIDVPVEHLAAPMRTRADVLVPPRLPDAIARIDPPPVAAIPPAAALPRSSMRILMIAAASAAVGLAAGIAFSLFDPPAETPGLDAIPIAHAQSGPALGAIPTASDPASTSVPPGTHEVLIRVLVGPAPPAADTTIEANRSPWTSAPFRVTTDVVDRAP